MKLSECKHGMLVQTLPHIKQQAVGMVVGLTEIAGAPEPLIKFSHLQEPTSFFAEHLEPYEG